MIGLEWPSSCLDKTVDPNAGVATLQCLPFVFQNVVNAALALGGVVAVFMILLSGYKYINSGGDPKQADSARNTLTYAIIGLILVLLSFFIVNVIAGLTGAECIKMFGFNNCT